MHKGLKQILNEVLEQKGYISLNEAYAIGAKDSFKQKTVERELNPSRSPNVKTLKNEKGQITGYEWRFTSPTHTKEACPSFQLFKVYCADCRRTEPKKGLF